MNKKKHDRSSRKNENSQCLLLDRHTKKEMEIGNEQNGIQASALEPKHVEQWEDRKRDGKTTSIPQARGNIRDKRKRAEKQCHMDLGSKRPKKMARLFVKKQKAEQLPRRQQAHYSGYLDDMNPDVRSLNFDRYLDYMSGHMTTEGLIQKGREKSWNKVTRRTYKRHRKGQLDVLRQ